ncbi:MAG TPA: dephospho-CoA kinase [bacterium]|nr:dephospho-CoA kinase [bacterium]HOR57094.1 dephospho-CoA kinase [bacterium]HPL56123.1 dephospho-CoA kinase [bacterium]HPM27694.1 dephospho-CoA kinase [bacterium]
MIIGITGSLAAGKDTVAQILEENGFRHISLSQILRDVVASKGGELTTENLTKEGNLLRHKMGDGFLAKRALENVKGDTVISSIRQPGELVQLRKNKHFFLINVDADPRIRWQRLKNRKRPGDPTTMEEMIKIEKKQMKAGGSKDMQLDVVASKADYIINNDGSLSDLQRNVDKVIKKIKKRV